ncbi:uncharacterized protein LOC26526415 [Drosophila erecta]|uniref:uncharacterized protein LOC26526415 n=1 Tax=Drosophila erecta TaxID=7220 RepID=UPI000F063224|nr:uncharacterized protein LOC26526415 [Drosophila erecta]
MRTSCAKIPHYYPFVKCNSSKSVAMRSYLLLGIFVYYLCTFVQIEGRDEAIEEENDSTNANTQLGNILLCDNFQNSSLQNKTRLNRSSLGRRMPTDHLGRKRSNHRRRVQTSRRNQTTRKLKYSTHKTA